MRAVVVLPTYNERENIEPYLQTLRAATARLDCVVDVLVVDDASPDGTADLARQLAAELGSAEWGAVEVLERRSKDGLGSAYRAGFAHVINADIHDVVISMDADLSHDPAVIPTMLQLIGEGADVVIGSRYVRGGGTTDWPVRRQLLSRWGNAYTRTVLRLGASDCTSGFRAYRHSVLAAIEPQTTSAEGYAFLTELVRRLTRHGYRIVETPIVFRDRERGRSKMSGRIIVESMLLVSRWALLDQLRWLRRRR